MYQEMLAFQRLRLRRAGRRLRFTMVVDVFIAGLNWVLFFHDVHVHWEGLALINLISAMAMWCAFGYASVLLQEMKDVQQEIVRRQQEVQ